MKTSILAAAAILSLGVATFSPAFAEGNNEPFDNVHYSVTRIARPVASNSYSQPDVGSQQYPNFIGYPGNNLSQHANNQVLPNESSEAPVQTANSLPSGFEDGTVAYAQAKSMNDWMVAHNLANPSALATR